METHIKTMKRSEPETPGFKQEGEQISEPGGLR